MFWKKKTSDKELFEYVSSGRRESFRLECEILGPVVATYKGRQAQIVDISAGGISFECNACQDGETGDLQLELPGKRIENVSISIKIIKITNDLICHCKFKKIDSEEIEKIHQYVLFRQIAARRKLKAIKDEQTDYE